MHYSEAQPVRTGRRAPAKLAPPHPSSPRGERGGEETNEEGVGRLLLQRARRLGDMRRDVVHQRRRQGVVGLQVKLLEPSAHRVHVLRIGAGFDDRRDEGGELRRLPARLPGTARGGRSRARRRGASCFRCARTYARRSHGRRGAGWWRTGSTIWSLSAFAVTVRFSRGTTATTENSAPSGFQHFVQPQAWSWATWPLMLTVTGLDAHLHFNVPPAKLGDSGFSPWSTAGWICIAHCTPPTVLFFPKQHSYSSDHTQVRLGRPQAQLGRGPFASR